jgi:ribonuclease HI
MEEGIVLEQIIEIPQQLHRTKLFELVDAEGRWNWSLFQGWLPDEFLKKIAAVIPPSADQDEDVRIMPGSSSNSFSVSNLYLHLRGYHGEVEHTIWKRIWRLQVPERVKTFIWMMLHGRLLTNSLKSKMRLCHAMSAFCGDVEENILHVLRDCPRAMEIWSCVIATNDRASFFMSEASHWIELNLNNTMHWNGEGSWSVFWAICCHCLWSWRNKELFDEGFVRPSRPFPVNQVAGCGGVLRGSHGEWLGGFAKGIGLCSAFVAELWGVYEGLSLAYRMRFKYVELEVDSEAVVRVLKKGCSENFAGCSLLHRIRQLMKKAWHVDVFHIYREANMCADALANLGCSQDFNFEFFDCCPSSIRDMYNLDMMGNTTPRFVCL